MECLYNANEISLDVHKLSNEVPAITQGCELHLLIEFKIMLYLQDSCPDVSRASGTKPLSCLS